MNPTLKLKEIARKLDQTNERLNSPQPGPATKPQKLMDMLDQKIDKVQHQLETITIQNQTTFTRLRDQVVSVESQLDGFKRQITSIEKTVQESVKQRAALLQEAKQIHERHMESVAQSIMVDFENRQTELAEKAEQEDRTFQSQLNMYTRKAHKVLASIVSEMNNQKKLRNKGLQSLHDGLLDRVRATQTLLQNQTRVRTETHRRLEKMVEQVQHKLQDDMKGIVRQRKQSNQRLLKMLEAACDTLI